MRLGPGILALGLLATSGFIGGFCITSGSGQYLDMLPRHHAESAAPNANEDAAAGIMAAGGDPKRGGHRHKTAGGGGAADEGSDGAAPEGGDAGAASAGTASAGDAPKTGGTDPHAGTAPRQLGGAEAAGFLAGNTVVEDASARRYSYFAPRGVRMDGNRQGFVARPWDRAKSTLCSPGSDGILVCRAIEVRTKGLDAPAGGSSIGELRLDERRWLPILSGNVESFPDHLPFLDSVVAEVKPEPSALKPTAIGAAALATLVGHLAAIGSAEQGRATTFVAFAKDGSRLDIERSQDDDAALKVTPGRWSFAKGMLCEDRAGADEAPACFALQAWGKTSLRLVPKGKDDTIRLDVLTETDRPQHQAAQ
ncbi:MAG TPA: hypothetical protein VH414_11920 [Lichenihabitans sp.]|nr:hypothetical protein [Lichenihabitans sp.]